MNYELIISINDVTYTFNSNNDKVSQLSFSGDSISVSLINEDGVLRDDFIDGDLSKSEVTLKYNNGIIYKGLISSVSSLTDIISFNSVRDYSSNTLNLNSPEKQGYVITNTTQDVRQFTVSGGTTKLVTTLYENAIGFIPPIVYGNYYSSGRVAFIQHGNSGSIICVVFAVASSNYTGSLISTSLFPSNSNTNNVLDAIGRLGRSYHEWFPNGGGSDALNYVYNESPVITDFPYAYYVSSLRDSPKIGSENANIKNAGLVNNADGSTGYTSNPAYILYDFIVKYSGYDASLYNLADFAALADIVGEIDCFFEINAEDDINSVITNIATICNADCVIRDGKIYLIMRTAKVKSGTISYEKQLDFNLTKTDVKELPNQVTVISQTRNKNGAITVSAVKTKAGVDKIINEDINITGLNDKVYAGVLAQSILDRYSNPRYDGTVTVYDENLSYKIGDMVEIDNPMMPTNNKVLIEDITRTDFNTWSINFSEYVSD